MDKTPREPAIARRIRSLQRNYTPWQTDAPDSYAAILELHSGWVFAFDTKRMKDMGESFYGDFAEDLIWQLLESRGHTGKSSPMKSSILLRGDILLQHEGRPLEVYLIAFLKTKPGTPFIMPMLDPVHDPLRQILIEVTQAPRWIGAMQNLYLRAHINAYGTKTPLS